MKIKFTHADRNTLVEKFRDKAGRAALVVNGLVPAIQGAEERWRNAPSRN